MAFAIPLPVLSFLAVPALSSYSTQLNILFFYMTWSTLLLSHSPLAIEFFGTFAMRTLFFTLPSLLFLAFDTAIPNVAQLIKAQGDSALPLRQTSKKLGLIVAVTLFNTALGVTVQTAIDLLFTYVLNMKSTLRVTTSLPLPWEVVKDLFWGILARGVSCDPRSSCSFCHIKIDHSFCNITSTASLCMIPDRPLPSGIRNGNIASDYHSLLWPTMITQHVI